MSLQSSAERESAGISAPFLQKPISLIETAFSLYGFLPGDYDPRWPFLSRYDEVKRTIGFKAINFANAWNATYLSDHVSYRTGFTSSFNPPNTLQLNRALENIEHVRSINDRYAATSDEYAAFDLRLTQTDRISSHHEQSESVVTPCPEALYQIQLYNDGEYLARAGFNLHTEDEGTVLSIVNIQGTPGAQKRNAAFEAMSGVSPFNLVVQRAVSMAQAGEEPYIVRGMINPSKGSSQLYWGVLEQEGVDMYHAHRKAA